MIELKPKSNLNNLDCVAESVDSSCVFYQLYSPVNRTNFWIKKLGPNYRNFINQGEPIAAQKVIIPDFGLKDRLLEEREYQQTWAEYYGLTVNEQSSNDDIIKQIQTGYVFVIK